MNVTDLPAPDTATAYLPLRKVIAVGVGNALDFYDFLTYSFFAVQISHCFFPAGATSHGLLYSLATFGVGFLTRPLGAIVIGLYGDRAGRRAAMVLSFSLMGAAITGLALTPSYAQIGVWAPVLLVLFRLVQGFALGGEVGPSTAFLIEAAPPLRRGLYVSLQFATQDAAVLCAGLAGFALSNWLDAAALDAWGWRLAFLLGAAIVPLGLAMRRNLPETLSPASIQANAPRPRVPVRVAVLGVMMLGAALICAYGLNYLTTFAQDSLHMPANLAFGATVVLGLTLMVCDVLAGVLSDRFGRKPVMLSAVVLLVLLVVPGFMVMVQRPSAACVYAVTALLAVGEALATGPALITITELLPAPIRSAGLGAIYAVAATVLGGSTQFMIKFLGDMTGSKLAPAWYLTVALAIGAVAMLLVRETAPAKSRCKPNPGPLPGEAGRL